MQEFPCLFFPFQWLWYSWIALVIPKPFYAIIEVQWTWKYVLVKNAWQTFKDWYCLCVLLLRGLVPAKVGAKSVLLRAVTARWLHCDFIGLFPSTKILFSHEFKDVKIMTFIQLFLYQLYLFSCYYKRFTYVVWSWVLL